MYILGFLFLFLGISLLLYSLLLLFFSKNQQTNEIKKNIVEPTQKEDTSSQNDLNIQPNNQSQTLSSMQNESQSFHKESLKSQETSTETTKNELTNKETPLTFRKLDDIKSQIKQKIIKKDFQDIPQEKSTQLISKDLELFITGYLYFDPAHTSYMLLEKKDKTPGDNLSNLQRLGNAALEWNKNSFILNYDEKQIGLMYQNLKEIRFMEDCAVFISKNPEDPYYFFLSKQINELKSFLHKLSNN